MSTVDLRSDTVTRPTAAMKRAMVEAPLGDDVYGDDPTVNALEARVAERAGKEAALFVPSGTMANQIALALHTRPGDAVWMHEDAHPFQWEAAGAAAIAGAQIDPLPGEGGMLTAETLRAHSKKVDPHVAPTALVCVEDTTNRGGGRVWPIEQLDEVSAEAEAMGLPVHYDGARAFNAVVASDQPLARRVRGAATVSLCLSKGLGCPVGSVLCVPADLEQRARRLRKMLGGGLRQSGMLAAAGLHALEHHVQRLADDHARAREIYVALSLAQFQVQTPETNMVFVDVPDATAALAHLREHGVLAGAVGPRTLRLVTHLDVDDAGVERTLAAFESLPR